MNTNRLEAFSDGVLAIIITIMVLELRPPEVDGVISLIELIPKLLAYVFSFVVLATYWNNHHHLLKSAKYISAKVMWANMHLLFWLSLIPFATAWLGDHHHYTSFGPVLVYTSLTLLCGLAYYMLSKSVLSANPDSEIVASIGKDKKGLISLIVYIIAVITTFWSPVVALVLTVAIAMIWFIPDRRLEQFLKKE